MLNHCEKEGFLTEHKSANVVISLFTTSAARIHLYKALKKVMGSPGAQVLYMDTDSVIYKHALSEPDPLPAGPHLGQLKDEKPHHEILEFISGGCKQYALKMRNLSKGLIEYDLKLRGITLDSETCERLPYETFKQMVLSYGRIDPPQSVDLKYDNFGPDKYGNIYSNKRRKTYKVIIQKGIVNDTGTVLPFGYRAS